MPIKWLLAVVDTLLLALLSIALTLWVSWQLDGGAAAVNEAGRMRMQAYRMALSVGTGDVAVLPQQAAEFERSLPVLHHGDIERPLFVPWDDTVRQRFAVIEDDWSRFARRWIRAPPAVIGDLRGDTASFAADIDALVAGIEHHMSRWTAFAVAGAAVLVYTGYLFVWELWAREIGPVD